jgi:hypothetical protein
MIRACRIAVTAPYWPTSTIVDPLNTARQRDYVAGLVEQTRGRRGGADVRPTRSR